MYDGSLDWFLTASDGACGVRSSLGGQIGALERMGAILPPNLDPYTDRQVGWGTRGGEGDFARERRLRKVWLRLSAESRRILVAHYVLRMPQIRRKKHEVTYSQWPPGVEGSLGRVAGVAVYRANLAGWSSELLRRCLQSEDVDGARQDAEAAVMQAHTEWERERGKQADEEAETVPSRVAELLAAGPA